MPAPPSGCGAQAGLASRDIRKTGKVAPDGVVIPFAERHQMPMQVVRRHQPSFRRSARPALAFSPKVLVLIALVRSAPRETASHQQQADDCKQSMTHDQTPNCAKANAKVFKKSQRAVGGRARRDIDCKAGVDCPDISRAMFISANLRRVTRIPCRRGLWPLLRGLAKPAAGHFPRFVAASRGADRLHIGSAQRIAHQPLWCCALWASRSTSRLRKERFSRARPSAHCVDHWMGGRDGGRRR